MNRMIANTSLLLLISGLTFLANDFHLSFIKSAVANSSQQKLSIVRVTPTGDDVPASRQIVIEFNRPVVPVGRMDRTAEELGITITPPLQCHWRWLNTTSLSCNLDDADQMKKSTSYQITIPASLSADDGATLGQNVIHQFVTERANVQSYDFSSWKGPGHPVIRVGFNQPVAKSAVEQHLFMKSQGKNDRTNISVTAEENDNIFPAYILDADQKKWIKIDPAIIQKGGKDKLPKGEEARRVWLIEPSSPLPMDTSVSLHLEKGLMSPEGQELSAISREILKFDTFPEFRFAGIRCFDNQENELLVKYKSKTSPADLCNPMRPASLAFTSPVLRSRVKDNSAFTPDLANGRKDYNPWGDENRDYSQLEYPHQKGRLYYVSLPIGLKAAQSYELKLPDGKVSLIDKIKGALQKDKPLLLEDEFGRTLPEPVSMSFSTNHRNPNFEMPYQNAVLEKDIASDVPLYVNNLTGYSFHYRSVNATSATPSKTVATKVNKVQDIQYAVPMNIRDMLGNKTGALFGTLETNPPISQKWAGAKRLFAQVTPWQAHLKLGHFNSLVWVTDLKTGEPVKDAKITLYKDAYTTLSSPKNIVASTTTDDKGIGLLPGTEKLSPDQDILSKWQDNDQRLFLRVDKGEDMALLPLENSFMLNIWELTEDNSWSSNEYKYGHMKSWGMTAQGIYRTGDTMQYKIFLRNQNNETLTLPPDGKYNLTISDPTGKKVDDIQNLVFSSFGAYSGEYKIPESAPVGWYQFRLYGDYNQSNKPKETNESGEPITQPGEGFSLNPMSVLVADFTPASFKVSTEINGTEFHFGDTMNIESKATMHSGGAYSDAAVQATVTLRNKTFAPDTNATKNFTFGSLGASSQQILQSTGMLNDKGEWNTSLKFDDMPIYYGALEVESAVQDDRGKSVAGMAQANYFAVDRFVGLKSEKWFYEAKKPVSLKTIVVDPKGQPISGQKIEVKIEREDVSIAKVKGAGNAYTSDVTSEWKPVATCSNISKSEAGTCAFTPPEAGSYRATATTTDTKNKNQQTEISLWVSGSDYVQWADDEKLSLPVVPERKNYKIGDTAKFMVKNPYPGANALVTVERYGILDQFVQKLDNSTAVIEVPIKPDYMPGFYLSVMVTSPRVNAPPPEMGQIDMGKPAFRMGYATVPVEDPYKKIKIDIHPDHDVYRPRDTVQVKLSASALHPNSKNEPIEIAVAVLDESVFDLLTNGLNTYDPYKGFYGLDALDMRNYSLLYRLLGRQKFELKGANAGGDGGTSPDMRTLFKYVIYWNPSLKTDENGNANFEFEAPDNLTGWKILAVATTPTDRMGLGQGQFKVNRPTEVRPVMPNQVREGDQFSAGVSVMNRTDKPRTLTVSVSAVGDINSSQKDLSQQVTKDITLQPYKRQTVYLPLTASLLPITRDRQNGKILFVAKAGDQLDSDAMEFEMPVLKRRVVDTAANYGTTTEAQIEEKIAYPTDIYTDTGELSVSLSPSVISNISGAFQYMRDYPYLCWEQILTKGVMAAHYEDLKPWMPDTFSWSEASTLPQATLDKAGNYQAPNGGMAYFLPKDEYVDPYLSAYTALSFEWLKAEGYKVPENVQSGLQDYLIKFLKQDTSPDFYQSGMKSTVRAVALSALAKSGKVTPADIQRYRPHLKEMSLFGKAYFLDAALTVPNQTDAAREAADMIMATANETGGKFSFSETIDDGYERLLATPLRDNCAVLSALLRYQQASNAKDYVGDKPFKLVRMITQSRGQRDYWENTQENMFCMNALVDYARIYESQRPDMTVSAKLGTTSIGKISFTDVKDAPTTLSQPIQDGDAGQSSVLHINKEGDGRLYYATRLSYALKKPTDNVNAGMDVHREYSIRKADGWTILKKGDVVKRGDAVRVDLYVSLPAPRNFVVVNDPLPGALETVNRDLATASKVDDNVASYDKAGGAWWFKFGDWQEFNASFWSFYHRELRHDSARFFADWLPAGNYHLSYMTQVIADGSFTAPPTQAEEMYDPDVYGRGSHETLNVQTP